MPLLPPLDAKMTEEVEKEARRELDRLRKIHVDAAEYMVARSYLDWLVQMLWATRAHSIRYAYCVLCVKPAACHCGALFTTSGTVVMDVTAPT